MQIVYIILTLIPLTFLSLALAIIGNKTFPAKHLLKAYLWSLLGSTVVSGGFYLLSSVLMWASQYEAAMMIAKFINHANIVSGALVLLAHIILILFIKELIEIANEKATHCEPVTTTQP